VGLGVRRYQVAQREVVKIRGGVRTCPWLISRQWRGGVSQVNRIPFGLSDRDLETPEDGNNVVNHEFNRRVCTPRTTGRLKFEDKETDRRQ